MIKLKWLNNQKIGIRILSGFLLVAIIAVIIGASGIFGVQRVNDSYKNAYTDSVGALEYTERISSYFQRIRVNIYGAVMAPDLEDKKSHIKTIEEYEGIILQNIAEYKEMLSVYEVEDVEEELVLINAVQSQLMAYVKNGDVLINGIGMENYYIGESYSSLQKGVMNSLASAVDSAITDLVNYNNEYSESQIAANGNYALSTTTIVIVVAIIGVILAILLGLFISRGISKPINMLVATANQVAQGDMDIEKNEDIETKDEVGMLAKSINAMVNNIREQALVAQRLADADLTVDVDVRSEKDMLGNSLSQLVNDLNEIMAGIATASEQVAAGSKQIAASSSSLSQGSTEQASSIEELSASIEEISSQTKVNAENADKANELAETAQINATKGNSQMQEMVKAMEDVNEASSNISKVIKVIDDIAFQTNMLSLNAAVEAARAGQYGKGFAVVAEEVKNLATRSANAAKETTEMIEGSIKKTEVGTKIAKETAEALKSIVEGIENVASLVGDISVASNEQYAGISQINQGIVQISQVVQNNSATSEESAAASEELSSQAQMLNEMVARFKLKEKKNINEMDDLSPEVLDMLKDMYKKGKINSEVVADDSKSKVSSGDNENEVSDAAIDSEDSNIGVEVNPKILLSDEEFGKY